MRLRTYQKVVFFFFCFLLSTVLHAEDPMVGQLEKTPFPEMRDPGVLKTTLPSGIKLYYLKDAELPVIKIKSSFEFGSVSEQKNERGLVDFFMSALRNGGTTTLKPSEVDQIIEHHAAKISGSAGAELSSLQMSTLQKHADPMLKLYFDLIRHPGFDAGRVEVIRKAMLSDIERRNEEPMQIASREFEQSLYGKDSPYAWLFTPETIQTLTIDDLRRFQEQQLTPDHLWIAATSPLEFADFQKLLQKFVGDWQARGVTRVGPKPLEKTWQQSLEFIHKPGNQSAIVVGHFGDKRFNPDRYAIVLADQVLGGETFGSRLGDRIRTELGLTYGVSSAFSFDTDYGSFEIATRTKSESTAQTVKEILTILRDMQGNRPITEAELHLAKERILNQIIFEYDSPFNLVSTELYYDYFGYPPHYLSLFPKKIREVSLAETNAALTKYFFPDRLKILIVGDRDKIPDLKDLGAVTEIPLDNE